MRNPTSILAAAIAIGAMAGIGAASAADLAERPYAKAPVVDSPIIGPVGMSAAMPDMASRPTQPVFMDWIPEALSAQTCSFRLRFPKIETDSWVGFSSE